MGVASSTEDAAKTKKLRKSEKKKVRISRRSQASYDGPGSESSSNKCGSGGSADAKGQASNQSSSSLALLSDAMFHALIDDIDDDTGSFSSPVYSSTEEEFYHCIPNLHLARAEGRIIDMLEWLAAMRECDDEARASSTMEANNTMDHGDRMRAADLRNECLRGCEAQVQVSVENTLAVLSKERKGPNSKAVRHKMKQIQRKYEKLGLAVERRDPAAEHRQSALAALQGACTAALEALTIPTGKVFT